MLQLLSLKIYVVCGQMHNLHCYLGAKFSLQW